MRLKKIKLAGFKSFVDPTTLELSSPLVAIVGPNGCGKSNVIDAIRWVMGESSAKNLRGESMSDVIFNGSTGRKPVGQASIELIFDNAEGRVGGEYAAYSEIAVRRQATRDGQSAYFLNGTRCRRRDITELFMGTGLGPRSYAIIEQGMISRVIEARPEDLRAFLEEAAGISLYRKRRQETETRMRHTRENLDRLEDLRQELEKQIERLKRQSESAERYKQYKQEQDTLEVELTALRFRAFNEQLTEHAQTVRKLNTALEGKFAKRASVDLELTKHRELHSEKTTLWKGVQSQYYDIGEKVARVEQTLEHHRERTETYKLDLIQIAEELSKTEQQIAEDKTRFEALQAELIVIDNEYQALQEKATTAEAVLFNAEEAMRHWSLDFEVFQQNAEIPQRTAEVEKARIEQLEKQSREAAHRLSRIREELAICNADALEANLQKLSSELFDQETIKSTEAARLKTVLSDIGEYREKAVQEAKNLNELTSELQSAQGRFASLEALQQAALGKTNEKVKAWLLDANFAHCPRLGEELKVKPGYERAVETVLGNALEAICVPGFDAIGSLLPDFQSGHVMLLDTLQTTGNDVTQNEKQDNKKRVSDLVETHLPIQALLHDIYVVEELSEALNLRNQLAPSESVVTREGVWLGKNWLKVYRGEEGHSGLLQREEALKELAQTLQVLKEKCAASELELVATREKVQSLESDREQLHQREQQHTKILTDLSVLISSERTRLEHMRTRLARLQSDRNEQNQILTLNEEETALSRIKLQTALDSMEELRGRKEALQQERETLRTLLQKAQTEARLAKENVHTIALKHQTVTTQKQATEQGLDRLVVQKTRIQERTVSLQTQLKNLEGPTLEAEKSLTLLLQERLMIEKQLNEARNEVDGLENTLRAFERQRGTIEFEAEEIREQLDKARMEWQAIEVRCQTIQEKLTELNVTVETILLTLSPEASEAEMSERLEQISKKIERLGAINLAAIEEFQTEIERKEYLDSQHKDLTEALETLENAIRKIDRETRARFKEIFDKVNDQFQVLFPRLFGGGQAYLELIGEDLLEAGVTVMARPPGKRNSSIHLLSGGEKALTAVSLVFAIFQLNPAPFCLLDEVDAPLDDANVGRFCELVKHMANSLQVIFVTHNKLAMEMAHHLIGVTMKEPGVSRLVSVDIEEAANLVAS